MLCSSSVAWPFRQLNRKLQMTLFGMSRTIQLSFLPKTCWHNNFLNFEARVTKFFMYPQNNIPQLLAQAIFSKKPLKLLYPKLLSLTRIGMSGVQCGGRKTGFFKFVVTYLSTGMPGQCFGHSIGEITVASAAWEQVFPTRCGIPSRDFAAPDRSCFKGRGTRPPQVSRDTF